MTLQISIPTYGGGNGVGTPARRIELREWESQDLELTPAEIADLSQCPRTVLDIRVIPGRGASVTPGPFAGLLRLGRLHVRILPKCPVPTLLAILAEAHDLPELQLREAGYATSDDLVDLLVGIFLAKVDNLVRGGLKRTYIQCEEELQAIRGRIDVRGTMLLHLRGRARAKCSFEEFTLDGPENRALLAALDAVAASQVLPPVSRRLARRRARDFGEVRRLLVRPDDISKIHCDRLNAHYEAPLRLARLILEGLGLEHQLGGFAAQGFLLNMNSLFELFVARRLQRLLSPDGIEVRCQERSRFDEAGNAHIRPDLLLYSQSGHRLVADTKYKLTTMPDSSDLYQMLSYCRILGVRHGVLITAGVGTPRSLRVLDGATLIDVVPISLDGTLNDVRMALSQLADHLRRRLAVHSPSSPSLDRESIARYAG